MPLKEKRVTERHLIPIHSRTEITPYSLYRKTARKESTDAPALTTLPNNSSKSLTIEGIDEEEGKAPNQPRKINQSLMRE